jgi:hypothetical protein
MGTPCHVPRKAPNQYGYVMIRWQGKMIVDHKYLWQLENGPIQQGMVSDHICRNRPCCNVDHLRIVTQRTNCTENHARNSPTHCPHGHAKTPENYRPRVKELGRISHQCVVCLRIRQRAMRSATRNVR